MRSSIILAGGKGSRLNGNKALTLLCGRPLYTYSLEVASKVAEEVILVVKRGDFGIDGVELAFDPLPESSPLVGIYSGLLKVRGEYTLVLPCDAPFLKSELLERLFEEADGFDAAIPIWRNGNIEPLISVYKSDAMLEASGSALKKGCSSPREAIAMLKKVNYVDVEGLRRYDPKLMSFFNVNTEADLELAERILGCK